MLRNRRRWVVTSLVLVISAVAYVDRVNLSVAAPVLTKEFGTNAAVMGLLLSSFTWSYALFNIPAGMLVDRIRTRVLYSGAMLLWGVASFLTALTNSVGALFGPRLLLGVAESPFIPASVRTLSDWLPKSERGAGGGVFISGVALGSAVGPPILGWLVSDYGWRSAFIATGVLSVAFAVGWFAWYRHPADDRKLSDTERALILADQEPDRPEGRVRAPWSALLRNRDVWAITGGYFCLLYIQYTFVSWLPSYLVQDRQMTVLKSGLATSIPWTCAFLVAVLFGRTSDVLMRRGWSARGARKVVLVGGMAAALAILGTAFSSSATSAIVFLSISTSGIVLANGAAWAATQDVTRRLNLPGSASGFINGISNVGGILGPIVTGALVYATSSFVVPLVVAAGVALVGGLIWLLGIRHRPEPAAGAGAAGAGEGAVAAAGPARHRRGILCARRALLGAVAVLAVLGVAAFALYPGRADRSGPLSPGSHAVAQAPAASAPEVGQPAPPASGQTPPEPAQGPVPPAGEVAPGQGVPAPGTGPLGPRTPAPGAGPTGPTGPGRAADPAGPGPGADPAGPGPGADPAGPGPGAGRAGPGPGAGPVGAAPEAGPAGPGRATLNATPAGRPATGNRDAARSAGSTGSGPDNRADAAGRRSGDDDSGSDSSGSDSSGSDSSDGSGDADESDEDRGPDDKREPDDERQADDEREPDDDRSGQTAGSVTAEVPGLVTVQIPAPAGLGIGLLGR